MKTHGNATLSLDLGCKCGFAIRDSTGGLHSARWELPAPAGGDTWLALWTYLEDSHTAHGFALVLFEEVVFAATARSSQVHGGLRAILEMWCKARSVPLRGYGVPRVKKTATGKGNADKAAMVAAAERHFPGQRVASDDEADALCLLYTHEKGREADGQRKRQGGDS